jgi:predicted dehydrogenase
MRGFCAEDVTIKMQKLKVAVFGTGFMGRVHTEALRRLGNIEVAGVAGSSSERAKKFADEVGIEYSTADYRDLLADPEICAVHICTPNSMHFEMVRASLEAAKHVLCEKPLAANLTEAAQMIALAKETQLANCTLYNVRSYPQLQNARRMREAGEFGEIRVVQGTYSQDWLTYDTDWNWRVECGASRTFADIGTHWTDLVEHVCGLPITSLCADLHTFLKTRKKPRGSVETFAGKRLQPTDYHEVPITTEDFGSMIFRLGESARGCMTASQVAVGRKNRLFLEIFGTKASAAWDAESPDQLWIGHRNLPNQVIVKDPSLLRPGAEAYADLPGGHSEGYDDTFKQTFRRFYRTVADREAPVEYPTFEDGMRQMRILDAVLESSRKRAWVTVET